MPRGPKGERRPRDVIGNAVHVMRLATGEITEPPVTFLAQFVTIFSSGGCLHSIEAGAARMALQKRVFFLEYERLVHSRSGIGGRVGRAVRGVGHVVFGTS